jgi:hypothetical protein
MSEQPLHAESTNNTPWYRYPWVWFVFCIPLSAVAFGVVMIVSANYQPDDLVVDDYYKEGMGINRRLQMDDEAQRLGATATLTAVTQEGVVFNVTNGGDALGLELFHVTDRNQDLRIDMRSLGQGVYVGESTALARKLNQPGIWYLELRDETSGWRLRKRISTPVSTLELGD